MGFKIGDVVSAGTRGDLVVAEARQIKKGRHAGKMEYSLAPLEADRWGNAYGLRAVGESQLKPATKKWTAAQIQAAVDKYHGTKGDIAERKQAVAEAGREAIGDIDMATTVRARAAAGTNIAPGMIVTVRYKDVGNRDEVVAEVNPKTGKIGIQKRNGKTRWLESRHIVAVKCQEKALPHSISDRTIAKLLERGWAQMRFGREFISASCVVAFSREDATRGQDYECASHVVYHDPNLNLYWRSTGSFD